MLKKDHADGRHEEDTRLGSGARCIWHPPGVVSQQDGIVPQSSRGFLRRQNEAQPFGGHAMQKIVPCLWFNTQAEEVARFYTSLFQDAAVLSVTSGPDGKVMTVSFQLEGQEFIALNGGPEFHFTEAVSFFVKCETQEEVDRLWGQLTDGGEEGQCGWLKDKYGLSWQIIPNALGELMQGTDPEKSGRAMQAMLKMQKIVIKDLQAAYNG
jgi:predicted 3-demethylubiquinone-9 3-methyltransferase (glyoxalase superfamily)